MAISSKELLKRGYSTTDEIIFRKQFFMTTSEEYTLTLKKNRMGYNAKVTSRNHPNKIAIAFPFTEKKAIALLTELNMREELIDERIKILSLLERAKKNYHETASAHIL